jgi:casein kinase II subunit beta
MSKKIALIFTFNVLGLYNEVEKSMVKLYCPQCMEIYFPSKIAELDGAYFGTGFPEMVFMTRPELRPFAPKNEHVSKIYRLKIHSSAIELQKNTAKKKEKFKFNNENIFKILKKKI